MRRPVRDALQFLVFVSCTLAARSSVADHYVVPTGSMIPTVLVEDHVVVNHLAYDVHLPFTNMSLWAHGTPARGDVVTLTSPEDGKRLLKRVVAVPGDEVRVRNGRLMIGGQLAAMDAQGREILGPVVHAVRLTAGGGRDFGPAVVPSGRYLVMGDNRGESHDGRMFGFVDRTAITGRAIGVFWRSDGLAWQPL